MSRKITIYLNDALYNAGILGFFRLYYDKQTEFKLLKNSVEFDVGLLNEFTMRYLQKLEEQFGHETVYQQVIKLYVAIPSEDDLGYEDAIKKCLDKIKDKLGAASYKSGYEIIKSRGCDYNFLNAIKEIPQITDLKERREALDEFIEEMKKYRDVFILKGIAYTKVSTYWNGVSFLHTSANQREFAESMKSYFEAPAVSFVPIEGRKATVNCCQCQVGLSKKDGKALSWVTDVGIDSAKKPSSFWNYNVDTYVCPVCALIYACIPLGFTILRDEGIFINNNNDLNLLIAANAEAEYKKQLHEEAQGQNVLYGAISKLLSEYQELISKNIMSNIQVVRRNSSKYTFDVISVELLKKISGCKREIDFINGNWIRKEKSNVNLYNEVMNRILKNRNLYGLIDQIFRHSLSENKRIHYIYNLISIQAMMFADDHISSRRKENSMDKVKSEVEIAKGRIYWAKVAGESLNKRMVGDTQNENKIRGLSFKLINQLKTRDVHGYMDTLIRQYMSFGMQIPDFTSEMIKDESIFLDCGYAFIAGLQGENQRGKKENNGAGGEKNE